MRELNIKPNILESIGQGKCQKIYESFIYNIGITNLRKALFLR